MSNLGLDSYWTGKYLMKDLVQLRNPMTNRSVLINKKTAQIIGSKKSAGPYKNVKVR